MSLPRSQDLVAVIGMACRLPGARDIDEFWLNLTECRESVTFLTEDQLRAVGVPEPSIADPQYVRAAADAADLDMFDAELFGFTPRDAVNTDPQIRLFLEVCHAAVENAGYDPMRIPGSTGVYGSMGGNRYAQTYLSAPDQALSAGRMASSVLNMPDYLSTLVSYKFGFRGPSLTVHTACSSSLVAVHLAAQALRLGECDVALAGGSDIVFPLGQGYQWDDGGPVAPDGHCRPFDETARGTVFGSGSGVVVLKRLDNAIADRDQVLAVLRGSAVNNDGSTKVGFTAPGVPGQAAAIREAMAVAGVAAGDISYLEAHATGTSIGDPIEIAALTRAYESLPGYRRGRFDPIPISSVKGNVGHLGHAAGITSLIKVVLCLERERRVGTANFVTPNPQLQLERSPFVVAGRSSPWPRTPGAPRLAGVSALGFGGTNAHVVVAEGPAASPSAADARPKVVLWSGCSADAAACYQDRLRSHLESAGEAQFTDLASTLQDGRTPHRVRAAVVSATSGEALAALTAGQIIRARSGSPRRGAPSTALLFPGQAAQQPKMARGLYGSDPVFTETMDACLELFRDHGLALADVWRDADAETLADTLVAQPLLFAVEYALAAMWRSWGVRPALLLGHSIGELTAAAVGGIFDLPTAVGLVAARARAMAQAPSGGMLAVSADPAALGPLLPAEVTVAVVNGPRQTVLAGPHAALDALADRLARDGRDGVSARPLAVSHAFHSPLMAESATEFAAAFTGLTINAPTVPVISAAVAREITEADARDPKFWASQIVAPVRFDLALDALAETEVRLLIDVGPGQTIGQLARRHPAIADSDAVVVVTQPAKSGDSAGDLRAALSGAASAWVEGHELNWPAVRAGQGGRRVKAPGYPYQRTRYWPASAISPKAVTASPASPDPSPPEPFTTMTWAQHWLAVGETPPPAVGAKALALVPADSAAGLPVTLALQQAGYDPVLVRVGGSYRDDEQDLRVRSGHPEDVGQLLIALADRGIRPRLVAHALTTESWPSPTSRTAARQLKDSFHSLRVIARHAVQDLADGAPPHLLVVTSRSVDVTGAEPVDPVKSALVGLVRTLALEAPDLGVRLIDVAEPVSEDLLAAEITAGTDAVVALRGPARWLPTEQVLQLAGPGALPLRKNGTYLVTGGLGGLGLVVARTLAATGLRPHLVLVGRSGMPGEETGAGARARREVAELTAMGARVRTESCDVADPRAVRRLITRVTAGTGQVNGVLHLAGVAGNGMLVVRDAADADAVLRPKVQGTLALAEALADEPAMDFYVAFSSRAAIGGLVGSADYAAANAFLDAHTRLLARSGWAARTINWPAWQSVGMAAQGAAAARGPAPVRWETEYDPTSDELLDEHRVNGVPVMPGTGYLDLVLRAFRSAIGPADAAVEFERVVFRQPLLGTAKRSVLTAFRSDGQGWRWEISSAPVAAAGEPEPDSTVHAEGAIRILAEPPAPEAEPLAQLRERLTAEDALAPQGPNSLFTLGPRWTSVLRSGKTTPVPGSPVVPGSSVRERLLELELPAAFHGDLARRPLHPSVLDAATSGVRDGSVQGPFVPFHYGSLTVYGDLPARCVSHVIRRPSAPGLLVADVTVYAPGGSVLAVVREFTMRQVRQGEFAAEDKPGAASKAGIPLAEGMRLFRAILGGGGPPQVAVRPWADGRYVPLAGPAGAAPAPAPGTARTPASGTATAEPGRPDRPGPAASDPPGSRPGSSARGGQPSPEGDPGSLSTRLRDLWAEVLGRPAIQPEDDFFELGGDSLVAVELISRIRESFGVSTSIVALFENPTLAAMAVVLADQGGR